MAAPYGQGPPPQYQPQYPPQYPPQGQGLQPNPYGQSSGIAAPPPGYGGVGPYSQPPQPQTVYGLGPQPGYGAPPPQLYGGNNQQLQTVTVMTGGPTVVHQTRKQRFADQICINVIIVLFFPFWIFVWIFMCIFEPV